MCCECARRACVCASVCCECARGPCVWILRRAGVHHSTLRVHTRVQPAGLCPGTHVCSGAHSQRLLPGLQLVCVSVACHGTHVCPWHLVVYTCACPWRVAAHMCTCPRHVVAHVLTVCLCRVPAAAAPAAAPGAGRLRPAQPLHVPIAAQHLPGAPGHRHRHQLPPQCEWGWHWDSVWGPCAPWGSTGIQSPVGVMWDPLGVARGPDVP